MIARHHYLYQAQIVVDHFYERESYRTEVESPKAPGWRLSEYRETQTLRWRTRESPGGTWVEYIWELHSMTSSSLENLRARGIPTDNWWQDWAASHGFVSNEISSILLPTNEAALEVHLELNLPLPEGFDLDEYVVGREES